MAVKRFGPVGIIDIGSNSVRFVAYGGAARIPSTLFNEKIMAALGRGVARNGMLDEEGIGKTLEALARFRQLAREMRLKKLHTVATAAVRDAKNGKSFLKRVAELGLKPRLLSGSEEAQLSGLGVISAIPEAKGMVADLGGGSLELIGVARGAAGAGISLPLGVLRVGSDPHRDDLSAAIKAGIKGSRLKDVAKNSSLYLVGGSFRALALLDMKTLGHPLPIVHHHRINPARLPDLKAILATLDVEELKLLTGISTARLPTLPAAVTLLEAMIDTLSPRRVVVSAFGIREGLLYGDLDEATKDEDPLLAAALEIGDRLGRFGDHGAALDQWMDPLFPDDGPALKRYRLAACLLGDIAWNAHPDYRAERAVDLAVHGNWVGIDANGRAVLGRALCSAFSGDAGFSPEILTLLRPGEDARVSAWGRAIRLAQRLSGGTEALLRKTRIGLEPGRVVLSIPTRHHELYADSVDRRLHLLARALGRVADVRFT
jgi:exopolyphosphatase / guanosine-5'-triphosphate,3'-diphosphate pyrophosphatase